MGFDKKMGILLAAVALIIIMVLVLLVDFSPETPDKQLNEDFESQLEAPVEKATEKKPHTPIKDPEMVSGVSKVLGTSYFNRGFDECVDPGAHLDLECDTLVVNQTSAPKKVRTGSSEVLVGKFVVTGDPGSYRCTFNTVCGNETVASSSTSIKVVRQAE
ncbi:MAG: hypothetical protein ACLFTH_02980 [Candidatus Woesearchaeota archaeon]